MDGKCEHCSLEVSENKFCSMMSSMQAVIIIIILLDQIRVCVLSQHPKQHVFLILEILQTTVLTMESLLEFVNKANTAVVLKGKSQQEISTTIDWTFERRNLLFYLTFFQFFVFSPTVHIFKTLFFPVFIFCCISQLYLTIFDLPVQHLQPYFI